ncbi:MAG TPA: PAS domain S-box protein [Vicinamibacterales bacterium]
MTVVPVRRRSSLTDPTELLRLRLAIEASGEIIFTTDEHGTFTYVNPEFERVYGHRAEDVVGRVTPRLLQSGSTGPDEYAVFWRGLTAGSVVRRDFINRASDGTLVHISGSANPIVDESGCIVGFLAVQRDVTARRDASAALRRSELRYRALTESAPDAIFIVNASAEIEYDNGVAAGWFDLAEPSITGKRFHAVFPQAIAEGMWQAVSTVLASGTKQVREQAFETHSGELWIETSLVPITGEDGMTAAVLGVARDVTERKSLERQFLHAQRMEAVGRLAGGVAHDFNNLLTAILGYTEFVRDAIRGCAGSDAIAADLDEVRKAGERATYLTRQLLAFSRKNPSVSEQLDVNAIVVDVHRMLERILGEDIEMVVAANADAATVCADRGQIEQVLMNLSVNARDAMPKGGRLTIMTADAWFGESGGPNGLAPGAYLALSVRDTGCGMPRDVMERACEPFFTTKALGEGTGLGLSTVYGIVRQNGGDMVIDSRPDAGTLVTIFWPMAVGGVSQLSPEADALPHGAEVILIVEDDTGVRTMIRRVLEPCGYAVIEAQDVDHALALAGEDRPIDLLLTDVIMPGLNGPDLAQRIVARRPGLKVLYVSGFANALLSKRGATSRVTFLSKPFTPSALAARVRSCLDS